MITSLSPKLKKIVDGVMEKASPCNTSIDCIIYSPDNPEVKLKVRYFNEWNIVQKFDADYTDTSTMNVSLHTDELIPLLQNTQNLRCAVLIYETDTTKFTRITTKAPTKFNFRVIIANSQDLLKAFGKYEIFPGENGRIVESQHSRTFDVEFQFIDDEVYHIRHKQFNGMVKNVTMEDTIYYVANLLGIKKISLVPPDNTRKYSTVSLPPMLDISTVFDFLQTRYGIYSKGLYYYITNGTLVIYPGYETNPKTDQIVNIYNVPEDTYLGSDGYHYIDEYKNLHIVSNTKSATHNLSEGGVENKGNVKIALRTDMSLDHIRSVQGDKGTFNSQKALSCGLTSQRSMVADAKNTKYETSSNNAFQMTSELTQLDCVLLGTGWNQAVIGKIAPGQKIVYHYDDQSVYKTKTGIVERLEYVIASNTQLQDYIYTCTAALIIRLTPE